MALRLPRLPKGVRIVDANGFVTDQFRLWWQRTCEAIEAEFGAIEAAEAAQAAADTAIAAAATAETAASDAQTSADSAADIAALTNSGVTGATLTGSDAGANATITISGHTRVYGNATSVSVTGGSVTGLAYSTLYYVYYDQASRAGGAVTYVATTSQTTAAQTGDRHLVGQCLTPAAAAPNTDGDYVAVAGIGNMYF